jgi:NADPH-dependent 2,4-dienoyl-CoA reductase/sulfur reductase-like enzyme
VLLSARRVVEEVHDKKSLRDRLEAAGVEVIDGAGDVRFRGPPHRSARKRRSRGSGGRDPGRPLRHLRRRACPEARLPGFRARPHPQRCVEHGSLPESVAIIGAAATGCQLASVFAAFGSRVRLLDLAPRVLPGEDEDVSRVVGQSFERRGIQIETGIGGVNGIERVSEGSGGPAPKLRHSGRGARGRGGHRDALRGLAGQRRRAGT